MKSMLWMKFIAMATIFCLLCATLSSCGSLVSLTYENALLVDKDKGVRYTFASVSYEPVSIGEPYAEYKKSNMILYTIPGLSPTEWLAEEYEGMGSVFYSTEVTLPTLAEFEPSKILVSVTADVAIPLVEITDAEDITAIVTQLETGERAILPATHVNSYTLKFASDKYPALYYTVRYLDCGDGQLYLVDRGEKITVYADGLLKDYIKGDEIE